MKKQMSEKLDITKETLIMLLNVIIKSSETYPYLMKHYSHKQRGMIITIIMSNPTSSNQFKL